MFIAILSLPVFQQCWRRNLKIYSGVQLISRFYFCPFCLHSALGRLWHTHIHHNLVSYSNTIPGPGDLHNQVQTLRIQSHTPSVSTQVLRPNCTHSHVSKPLLTCHTPRRLWGGAGGRLWSLYPQSPPRYCTCCDQTDGLLHRQPATARIRKCTAFPHVTFLWLSLIRAQIPSHHLRRTLPCVERLWACMWGTAPENSFPLKGYQLLRGAS